MYNLLEVVGVVVFIFGMFAFVMIVSLMPVFKHEREWNAEEERLETIRGKYEYGHYIDKEVFNDGNIKKRIWKAEGLSPLEYIIAVKECPGCKSPMCNSAYGRNKETLKWTCNYCKHEIKY